MNQSSLNTAAPALTDQLRSAIEEALSDLALPSEPDVLYAPVRHVLEGGGKRFRPVLLLLVANTYGVSTERAMPAALAVEIFHNFTLVHDDIMDHADTRRGRPTVHTRWDEPTAILSGDYMLALSYRLLVDTDSDQLRELLRVFGEMVEHLCEGQALDKAFETAPDVSLSEYIAMIDLKTGALIRAALELGGILGGAGRADREQLRQIGVHLGRAFQIQDDLLDLVADDDRWGKTVGSDLVEAKRTFLLVRTLERTDGADRAWFDDLVRRGGVPAGKVPEARMRMERAGVIQEAREAVSHHTEAALSLIRSLKHGEPGLESLAALVDGMQWRPH